MLGQITYKKILAVLGLFCGLVWLAVFSFPDNKLHLVFCDVGQGDATLIGKGFTQILIDGGPNDKVLTCLRNNLPLFDHKIEIVALTHPDADHLTGLVSVLDKYEVGYLFSGPEGNKSGVYLTFLEKLKTKNLTIKNPYSGEKISIGGVTLDTLWPEREWVAENIEDVIPAQAGIYANNSVDSRSERSSVWNDNGAILGAETTSSNLNDFSLVFLLRYNGKTALLMGDADKGVQDKMTGNRIQEAVNSQGIDILKFPHHGSKTGMTSAFLEIIKPKEAVISVGKNSFGHPTTEALDLLKEFKVVIRRTDLEGEIKYSF